MCFWGHSLSVCMFLSSQFCVLRSLFVCRCRKCCSSSSLMQWSEREKHLCLAAKSKENSFALHHYFCLYCNAGKCACKYSSWLNWMLMRSYNFHALMHYSNAEMCLTHMQIMRQCNAKIKKLFIFFMQNIISNFLCWFWGDTWAFDALSISSVFLYVTHTCFRLIIKWWLLSCDLWWSL